MSTVLEPSQSLVKGLQRFTRGELPGPCWLLGVFCVSRVILFTSEGRGDLGMNTQTQLLITLMQILTVTPSGALNEAFCWLHLHPALGSTPQLFLHCWGSAGGRVTVASPPLRPCFWYSRAGLKWIEGKCLGTLVMES